MIDLRGAAADYLAHRRALGFKLARADGLLNDFVDHLHARHVSHITTEIALEWATLPQGVNAWWWRHRLVVVRGFGKRRDKPAWRRRWKSSTSKG